jgi:hypothetical protein
MFFFKEIKVGFFTDYLKKNMNFVIEYLLKHVANTFYLTYVRKLKFVALPRN